MRKPTRHTNQTQHFPQLFTAFICIPRLVDDGECLGFYDAPIDHPPVPETEAWALARRQFRTALDAIGYGVKPAAQGGLIHGRPDQCRCSQRNRP
jgi:hypothetical protein